MDHICSRCMRSMASWKPCWINNGADITRTHLCVACRRHYGATVDTRLTGEEIVILDRIRAGREDRAAAKAAGRERRRLEIFEMEYRGNR